MNEQSILREALSRPNPADQIAWVSKVCGDDRSLKLRVLALLQQHEEQQGLAAQSKGGVEHVEVIEDGSENVTVGLSGGEPAPLADGAGGVVLGETSPGSLQSYQELKDAADITLRHSAQEADDPIADPQSSEMPEHAPRSRYRLDGEIARGGMGAILRGRDSEIGRDLAIKVLLESHRGEAVIAQRFVEEAQISGQLQHPGIAPVYDMGKFPDGRPFFAMKLVKGETLSRLLKDRGGPSVDRSKFIGIFEQMCQTMAYVHARGVIHRDLKPANVMVGAFGEVQVMDWGLAKVMPRGGVADEKHALMESQEKSIIQTLRSGSGTEGSDGSAGSNTLAGSVMGTPSYMPPEQALGEIDQLNERADVFGLGAILCEVLTGKPPYVGKQALRHALQGKLDDCIARLDSCDADDELVRLAKQCLQLEPSDRPRDASILADQVTGYLESVDARLRRTELEKVEAQARTEEFVRRRKLHYAIACILLVALITAGFAVSHFRALEQTQRVLTEQKSDLASKNLSLATQAKQERNIAERETYRATIRLAESMLSGDDQARYRVADLLWETQPSLRGWEWGYTMARCPMEEWSLRTGHGALDVMVASADGRYLVTAGSDEMVALWDAHDQRQLWRRKVGRVVELCMDPEGRFLAISLAREEGGQLKVLSSADGRVVTTELCEGVLKLAFSNTGEDLYLVKGDHLHRYSTRTWRSLVDVPLVAPHRDLFMDVAGAALGVQSGFVPLRRQPANPYRFWFFDPETLEPRTDMDSVRMKSQGLHVDATPILDTARGTLTYASGNSEICRCDLATFGASREPAIVGLTGRVMDILRDDRSGSTVAATHDGTVFVLDDDGERRDFYHGSSLQTVAILGDGLLVTGGLDGLVKCWVMHPKAIPEVNIAIEGPVSTGSFIEFCDGGQKIFFKTWKKDAYWLVEPDSRQLDKVETGKFAITNSLRPRTGEVVVRDKLGLSLYTQEAIRSDADATLSLPYKQWGRALFDASGRILLLNPNKRSVVVFDLEANQALPDPDLPETLPTNYWLAMSPSGTRAAMHSALGLWVWEIASGRILDQFNMGRSQQDLPTPGNFYPEFHPDNAVVAVIDPKLGIVLRDVMEHREMQVIPAISGVKFWRCRFSPDGDRLLVQCSDSRSRLFDWRLGKELLALTGTTLSRQHCPIAMSPDGLVIAYGGHNPSLRVAKSLPCSRAASPSDDFYRSVKKLRQR